jgi:hypothetical protein
MAPRWNDAKLEPWVEEVRAHLIRVKSALIWAAAPAGMMLAALLATAEALTGPLPPLDLDQVEAEDLHVRQYAIEH